VNRRRIALLISVPVLLSILALIFVALPRRGASRRDRFYPFDPTRIRSVDFITPDRRVRLDDENGRWMLSAPVRDFTDRSVMLNLFGVLQAEALAPAVERIGGQDLKRYGLDPPELELRLGRGREVDTLRFGTLDPESRKVWVRASWTDSLLLLPNLIRGHFLKNRYDLSDKRPVRIQRARDIRSLKLENDRGSFALRRSGFGWEIVAAAEFPADPDTLRALLHKISDPAILDFLDEEGARSRDLSSSNVRARVEIFVQDETEPRRLEIGSSFHGLYLARNPARPSPFLLDSLTCAPFFAPMGRFLSRKLFQILPGRLRSVAYGDRRLQIAKGSEKAWVDQSGRNPALREVSRLIAFLANLSTDKVEALLPREDQLRRWGLDPPESSITIRERGRDLLLEIGPAIGGRRYFRRGDYPPVYSLPEDSLDIPWPGEGSSGLDH